MYSTVCLPAPAFGAVSALECPGRCRSASSDEEDRSLFAACVVIIMQLQSKAQSCSARHSHPHRRRRSWLPVRMSVRMCAPQFHRVRLPCGTRQPSKDTHRVGRHQHSLPGSRSTLNCGRSHARVRVLVTTRCLRKRQLASLAAC